MQKCFCLLKPEWELTKAKYKVDNYKEQSILEQATQEEAEIYDEEMDIERWLNRWNRYSIKVLQNLKHSYIFKSKSII